MATENTLKIRNIGQVEATRFVNTPGRGPGFSPAVKVTRQFPKHEIGKVVHAGGPRFGKFPKEGRK